MSSPPLKRYIVFSGPEYYPSGGWGDFRQSFDTLDEAKQWLDRYPADWKEIIDLENPPEMVPYD